MAKSGKKNALQKVDKVDVAVQEQVVIALALDRQ